MKRDPKNRKEFLDPTPMALPVGYRRPPTLQDQVRALVRGALSEQAANRGQETFEEADDFDVGDDYDPRSPYEQNFDHDQNIDALAGVVRENKKKKRTKTLNEEVPVEQKKAKDEPSSDSEK